MNELPNPKQSVGNFTLFWPVFIARTDASRVRQISRALPFQAPILLRNLKIELLSFFVFSGQCVFSFGWFWFIDLFLNVGKQHYFFLHFYSELRHPLSNNFSTTYDIACEISCCIFLDIKIKNLGCKLLYFKNQRKVHKNNVTNNFIYCLFWNKIHCIILSVNKLQKFR